jgi:D-beta-D-heptose 7-phosphate kinase/D-beta-D-heptose 1-phosphate adenosyltransferase
MMGKVVSQEDLLQFAGRKSRGQRRVVFTNGCFDLLHPGHIHTLEAARAEGDLLVVGVNTDRSVRVLKGSSRPIIPQAERAEMLAALAAVDFVVLFDEETPRDLVARLQPDVLAKGADWPEGEIVGADEVEAGGGRVVRLPTQPGYSTSSILERIRSAGKTPPVGKST